MFSPHPILEQQAVGQQRRRPQLRVRYWLRTARTADAPRRYVLSAARASGRQAAAIAFFDGGHGQSFTSMGHMSRTYKYATVPTVEAIEYSAEFPFVTLKYVDSRLPVDVTLTAWTPFIAHDHMESSTPGALFDFSVRNKTDQPVDVSIVYAGANFAGWDTKNFNHAHERLDVQGGTAIKMSGGSDAKHPTTGNSSLFAASSTRDSQSVSVISANPYLENIFLLSSRRARLKARCILLISSAKSL
jgi:hypothetical protein